MSNPRKCPNCGSFKTKQYLGGDGVMPSVGKFIAGTGCLTMFFALFFPPLFILSFLIVCIGGAIASIPDFLKGIRRFKCKSCGIEFVVTKS